MDREIAPEVRRRVLTRRLATVGVALAVIVFSLAATLQWFRPSIARHDLQMASVEVGDVDATLQASGTVVPASEHVVSSPVEARVLEIGRRAGDRVKPGDALVALDNSATRLEADRIREQVSQQESELAETRLRVEETTATLSAQLAQRELDAEILRLRVEQNAKLFREGLVSRQELLVAETAAKKAEIELQSLRAGLRRSQRSGSAQLAAASASLRALERGEVESIRQLELAMMRADREGVVTWTLTDPGTTVRRGDPVARIADLSSFRVNATITDVYAPRLGVGMRVRARVDDDTVIGGVISSIDPRMENGVARFTVDLDEPAHPKLRSNARVDLHVISGNKGSVLRVRRGVLAQSTTEEVFVLRDGELVSTPVRWGMVAEEHAEVVSGIRRGEQVVISDMSGFVGVKKVRLK